MCIGSLTSFSVPLLFVPQVQAWLLDSFDLEIHAGRAYAFLAQVGFSHLSPRPRHVDADDAVQADRPRRCRSVQDNAFKKTP